MTDPPDQPFPEQAEGDGAATNEGRPQRRSPKPPHENANVSAVRPPEIGSSVTTVTPPPPPATPDPPYVPDPRFEFARWVLAEKVVWRRVMVAFVVFLVAAVFIAALLAPHIGTLGGGLIGAAGGGAAVAAVQQGRKAWLARHEPPPPEEGTNQ